MLLWNNPNVKYNPNLPNIQVINFTIEVATCHKLCKDQCRFNNLDRTDSYASKTALPLMTGKASSKAARVFPS